MTYGWNKQVSVQNISIFGRKLGRLSDLMVWSGIALIFAFLASNLILDAIEDIPMEFAYRALSIALATFGLASLIFGSLLWRKIYGFFPDLFLKRGISHFESSLRFRAAAANQGSRERETLV
jgi:hypothetical protein